MHLVNTEAIFSSGSKTIDPLRIIFGTSSPGLSNNVVSEPVPLVGLPGDD